MFLLAALPLSRIYLGCGLLGASLFIVRMILMLVGAEFDSDSGMDMEVSDSGDIDAHDGDTHTDLDTDAGLHLLTVQGLMAFLMMFGFTGYAASTDTAIGAVLVFLISGAMGVFTMWLVAKLVVLMLRLQSSGTTPLTSAIGEEGTVYLRIPANDIGKIQVKVGQALKVMDARSENGEAIQTGTRICVTWVDVQDGRTLVVKACE